MKKKLLFIINPISGVTTKAGIPDLIDKYIDTERYDAEIYFTNYRGDAIRAATEAKSTQTEIVIAVGGDGTINEVASQLINSETALGIIPLGSGNGLARHLGIPLKTSGAMQRINAHTEDKMDAAYLNGLPFFNVAGMGFDAFVSYIFANLPGRGFRNYAKATWRALHNFKPFHIEISSGDKLYKGEAFLLSFANSSQFGNNCYINPKGIINDGKIEIVLLKPFPKIITPLLIWRLFAKKIKGSKYIESWSISEAIIESATPINIQIDGDPLHKVTKIELKVEKQGLKIIR